MSDVQDTVAECPLCLNQFPTESVEKHVNECLNQTSDELKNNQKGNKRVRCDLASWCTPMKNKAKTDAQTVTKKIKKCEQISVDVKSAACSSTPSPKPPDKKPVNVDEFKVPFAEQMRPKCIDELIGQNHILCNDSILRKLIESENIPSMILWGPPGCGKTSLANVIGKSCRSNRFVSLSATAAGVSQVKEIISTAKSEWSFFKRKTILFLDEIHRFNKLQQDTFLPVVENGTIILIGATTENPSFSLNSALLSRCRVFVLEKLSCDDVTCILQQAIKKLSISIYNPNSDEHLDSLKGHLLIEEEAVTTLAGFSDGDARIALNCLSLVKQAQQKMTSKDSCNIIRASDIKESLLRTHLLYDKKGDEHYNCISALHKSMRGDDADAALYWLARMLEGGEDPLYVARRLVRFSSEDVGLADPNALQQAVAAYQACQYIGMPECEVILAQCAVYLAEAPKSIRVYRAYGRAKESIKTQQGPLPGVPLHLRNAPTSLMKQLGFGKDYKYNPHYEETVEQTYLPECLLGTKFLDPE